MKAKTAFIVVVITMAIFRILVGVLFLTAQAEMTTLALRWIFAISGLGFIAYAIIRSIKILIAIDNTRNIN